MEIYPSPLEHTCMSTAHRDPDGDVDVCAARGLPRWRGARRARAVFRKH
jgi:hypothetical protein